MNMVECSTCGRLYSQAAAERNMRQDILKVNKPSRRMGPAQYSARCNCGGVTLRAFGIHDPNDRDARGRPKFRADRLVSGRDEAVPALPVEDPPLE